jgi:hypothetical protein
MINIPNKKHAMKERFQVRIFKKEILNFFILGSPVVIPAHLICLQKLILSSLIQWKNIKNLVSLLVSSLKSLFHLQQSILLRVRLTKIILQSGMFILVLCLGNILCFSKIFVLLNLFFYTTWIVMLKDMVSTV